MPLVVVISSVVDFEDSSAATATSERQVTVAKVCAGHVCRHKVTDDEYQTGSRFRPEVDL